MLVDHVMINIIGHAYLLYGCESADPYYWPSDNYIVVTWFFNGQPLTYQGGQWVAQLAVLLCNWLSPYTTGIRLHSQSGWASIWNIIIIMFINARRTCARGLLYSLCLCVCVCLCVTSLALAYDMCATN